jgi:S-adenosylmethionine-dependent methyltransferase
MPELDRNEEDVARYYDTQVFDAELARLSRDCPVERIVTTRWIERLTPEGSAVAEIGVGGGLYSECLARRGCRLHLVDISERLLDTAVERLRAAGLGGSIAGVSRESATGLGSLASGAFDTVLMLGPLYHLQALEARQKAVAEAARVLKTGGLLFAAGINRLAYFRELLRETPPEAARRRAFHAAYLQDGRVDPEHAPPIGFAHMTTVAEFRELFAGRFEELAMVGVESFSGVWQSSLNRLTGDEAEAWLEIIEQTGQTVEGLGQSDHFLYVGRRNENEYGA